MTLLWLLSWWNLIFVLPFALALIYLGLYTVSGITFGDADTDAGFDADADADVDADAHLDAEAPVDAGAHMDADAHADVDADADLDPDADLDGDAELHAAADADHDAASDSATPSMAALQWLGVGKVPVSILLMVLLLVWGSVGFVLNVVLRERVAQEWMAAYVSVPGALLAALIVTRLVVRVMAKWLPMYETTARRRHELLGCVGEAMFAINDRFGMASVRDDLGELYQVPCRVGTAEPPIAKGRHVRLVGYNGKQGIFRVVADDAAPRDTSRGFI
jgi:hypothetical protein